jgi:two-component system KDP operon response regulator KdpE
MTHESHILVIDDEPQILRALRTILSAQNYHVTTARNGEEGLAMAASTRPDLIVLDLGLPDMDGIAVCENLRQWSDTPIIVLSVRDRERDKVTALDRGADDYLTKPFGIDELLARIRVALRHSQIAHGARETIVVSGRVSIDLARHVVTRDQEEVKLTATEYKLLAYLASHAERVLTHHSILSNVWGPEYSENVEYLRVFISTLRHKLEDNPKKPQLILSEASVGYRFMISD